MERGEGEIGRGEEERGEDLEGAAGGLMVEDD